MIPSAFVAADSAAADAQRQDRPPRPAAPDASASRGHGLRRPAHARPRSCWPASWPSCCTSTRSGRVTTTSSTLGGHSLLATQLDVAASARLSVSSCRCAPCSRRPPWPGWPQAVATPRWPGSAARLVPPIDPAPRTRVDGRPEHRSRSPSSACGSWTSSSRTTCSTTCPLPCGCRGSWTWPRCTAPESSSCAATNAAHHLRAARRQARQVIAPRWPTDAARGST